MIWIRGLPLLEKKLKLVPTNNFRLYGIFMYKKYLKNKSLPLILLGLLSSGCFEPDLHTVDIVVEGSYENSLTFKFAKPQNDNESIQDFTCGFNKQVDFQTARNLRGTKLQAEIYQRFDYSVTICHLKNPEKITELLKS